MSLRKLLGKVLILGLLEVGALAGLRVTAEDIEKLMNVMHRTKIVKVVKVDDR